MRAMSARAVMLDLAVRTETLRRTGAVKTVVAGVCGLSALLPPLYWAAVGQGWPSLSPRAGAVEPAVGALSAEPVF